MLCTTLCTILPLHTDLPLRSGTVQEKLASLSKHVAAQQEAKEAAQHAAQQAQQELREAVSGAQAEHVARASAEAEVRSLNKRLHEATRRVELLEERLQVYFTFACPPSSDLPHPQTQSYETRRVTSSFPAGP